MNLSNGLLNLTNWLGNVIMPTMAGLFAAAAIYRFSKGHPYQHLGYAALASLKCSGLLRVMESFSNQAAWNNPDRYWISILTLVNWVGNVLLPLYGTGQVVLAVVHFAGLLERTLAITWIWAPALFVGVQQAYQQGVPGIFWFTFPNILSLMVIAPLAVRIRSYLPSGYSQPEWIRRRFDDKTHKMYLVPFFWYQLMAVTVQLYAGGSIFSLMTSARIEIVMAVLALTTLTYSLISGMRASIITDFLQYGLILLAAILVIPWTVSAAGGLGSVVAGLGGITGLHKSIFDPQVAFNFGIVTSIGLISGSLSDQQHWQRAFTIKQSELVRAYIMSGFLFGIVPLGVSLLGFLGANWSVGVELPTGTDPSMIGVLVVAHFLPKWAVAGFVIMLLGGLCSTLDSGMCAASSLYALNCVKFNKAEQEVREKERLGQQLSSDEQAISQSLDHKIVGRGRIAMVGITIAGALVALGVLYIPGFGLQYLWWVFNTVAACVAVPTVLSLYWNRLDSKGVFWGVLVAFFLGIPLFVYSNIEGITWLTVASSVGIVGVTTLFALAFKRDVPFEVNRVGSLAQADHH